jgi:hypothetical protein
VAFVAFVTFVTFVTFVAFVAFVLGLAAFVGLGLVVGIEGYLSIDKTLGIP